MQTSMRQITPPNQNQVACVAYGLWEKAGRPAGRDLEFWFKAEQQIAKASRPRMVVPTPDEQRPKTSPSTTAATAPATTTAFEWKSRSQIENSDRPENGPTARPTSTRGRRSAANQTPRSD